MDNESANRRTLKTCFRIVVEKKIEDGETGDGKKKKYLIDIYKQPTMLVWMMKRTV